MGNGYGTYDREIIDFANSDYGQGSAAALSAGLGLVSGMIKTVKEPMTVDRFGYLPAVAFVLTVPGQFGLYRYPHGMTCVDLATALDLCNNLMTAMIAHAADAVIHKVADTTNFSATLTPSTPVTTLATLMAQINLLITAFTAHISDESTSGANTFHSSDNTGYGNQRLSPGTPVTTLAGSIAALNDMLAKYNAHDIDVVAHYYGHRYQAYKVLLATIAPANGDAVGFEYICDVDNMPVEAVYPYQGLFIRGVADLVPGDQVAIEVTALTTSTYGTYWPFFAWHNRAEAEADMPQLVNRTPVKASIQDGTNRLAVVGGD